MQQAAGLAAAAFEKWRGKDPPKPKPRGVSIPREPIEMTAQYERQGGGATTSGHKGPNPNSREDSISRSGLSEEDVDAMPGGQPNAGHIPQEEGMSCDALGSGGATGLARLRAEESADTEFAKRCQALSGVLPMLGLKRRLKSCAVVGGSGILAQHPRGREIDQHEGIFRVNNCPVKGFEKLVGARTTVRFLNGPRSMIWAREINGRRKGVQAVGMVPELLNNDHVVVWGERMTLDRLKSAMTKNTTVHKANTRFRRECADKTFWSADELDRHRASNGVNRLEITFGFEAVAHALYACDRVSIYGFFLDKNDAERQTNAGVVATGNEKNKPPKDKANGGGNGKAMKTPYHYYENMTYDKSAKDPWRPWTYKFHNFLLEHEKFAQLRSACWLRIVTTD